jgi:ABC-type amino acid transport substrate-binding protein
MGDEAGPDEGVTQQHLVFTRPYLGQAYVLVVQGRAAGVKNIKELKEVKAGVQMTTPVDAYFFDHGYPRALYFHNREIIKALADSEIDAAMLWSPQLGIARKDFPNAHFHVAEGYVPEEGLRFNSAIALPDWEGRLRELLNQATATLLANGEIQRIVESYGVPFFPPFANSR